MPITKKRLTKREYEAKLLAQNNECGMCHRKKSAEDRFRLDVDSRTGYSRDLLCPKCYTFIHKLCRGDGHLALRMVQYIQGELMTPFPDGR